MKAILLTPLLLALSTLPVTIGIAQTASPTAPARFEVATIKPVDPAGSHPNDLNVFPGGRIVLRGYSLKALIVTAFNLGSWQLSAGESWMNEDHYDVEAKPPDAGQGARYDLRHTWWRIEDPRLRQMLQALLIDRFQLKLSQGLTTGTTYILETTGKTPLLRPTIADQHPFGDKGFSGDVGHAGDRWVLYNTSMPQLAKFISDIVVHSPVLDKTGLSGYFDAKWTETLNDPDSFDGQDSFPFFIQSLGLKLTKSTGPVETFVIDHAEPPTPN